VQWLEIFPLVVEKYNWKFTDMREIKQLLPHRNLVWNGCSVDFRTRRKQQLQLWFRF
jgi:hypothetical protein